MGPSMVYFHFSPARRQALTQVCAGCGIALREGKMNEGGVPLGTLFGMPCVALPGQPSFFTQELLVMCGLSSPEMDRFLAAWRAAGQSIIPCKAVLTPHNIAWTPAALAAELTREDERMRKGR